MPRIPVRAKTYQQLIALANPASANQPEAVAWWLYDTQTYTDNVTTELTFFAAPQADRSLSNLETAGALPDPQFFEVHYVALDIVPVTGFVTSAAGGPTGMIDDIGRLLARARWQLTISDKRYGPFPAHALHALGGPTGFGWGTLTAPQSLQYALNSVPDGGACFDGAVVIPPKVGFTAVMSWPAAVDLTGDYRLRLTLVGVLHRRVA